MPTVVIATAIAMFAFAANSILARLAMADGAADPIGFTVMRLASGALFLALTLAFRRAPKSPLPGSWPSALALFGYATAFSLAYVRIGAAAGALILFASVQATMIFWSLRNGERPRPLQLAGMLMAFAGILYLFLPGIGRPDPTGSLLMVVSGVAWGVYSLRGRGVADPIGATAGNFIRSVAFCLPLLAIGWSTLHITSTGLASALLSGVVASGLGYVIWYRALPSLDATVAAIVQLTVPIIASAGAIVLLGEQSTLRFALASVLVLCGVAVTIMARRRR